MKVTIYDLRCTSCAVIAAAGVALASPAPAQNTNAPRQLDLPTALRLAGARNLDVQIAREKLVEAKANHGSAVAQFFPWIAPGIGYKRHDGNIQDVAGNIIDVHKQSYAPGATVSAQVDLGDAYYRELAAGQQARAAGHALAAQQQESAATAALGYFDLLAAQAAVNIAADAVTIATNYEAQVERAVGAGLAFKGDHLRATGQRERNQLAWERALAERRTASTKLAQMLRLDPARQLEPRASDLVPATLLQTNLPSLIASALHARPELKQSAAGTAAARELQKGATYGPLVPTIGVQAFFGGLGGGRHNDWGNLDRQEDYSVGLSWRLGPGGLLDFDRQRAARARLNIAQLSGEKLRDEITRQVVDASIRADSLAQQLATSRRALAAAEAGHRLAQQRKEFGVGIVLETIQAAQDLTRARLDYARSLADFNKAQYELLRATGQL